MEKVVDARGLACPQPVIQTKKALETLSPDGELVTIVDNEVARDNVLKLVRSMECVASVREQGNEYYIHIRKESLPSTQLSVHPGQVLLVTSATLGRGSEELGGVLMRSFFYSLSETEVLPRRIIFINSGVHLCCQGSPVLDSLLALEQKGVEVLACGTCLDYYHLKEKLCIGSVTNMYTIIEHLTAAEKVITL
ncbi:MAG: sulfurtransferase-like selenium metabolism protein YedF [Moorella humiferrea]|uniref:SirA-like protein n=1 Tax=Neomoorella humiferrea TaxID=676965 RepID=A0A2T0ATY4_9FIRM|nr:sulfurtransferase-like selenium metabolism protein YedF [Moorella humiferrea]MBE3572442.1 sulfurtransferase-like selenium metabolism protein YedF [Moorella humiferrea]PRR73930.1 SirA-like protein [Moorella humiferrea]